MPTSPVAAEAELLSASSLVPSLFRHNANDCRHALRLAERLAEDPLTVMQNVCVHGGRLSWTPRFAVAAANRSGVFHGRIRWTEDARSVIAHARFADTGEDVSVSLSLDAALDEGLIADDTPAARDSLRWFAAARLVDRHAPELLLALPPSEVEHPPLAAEPSPASFVIYDEHGRADLRRPGTLVSALARVRRHLRRAANPAAVLELNAGVLAAAASGLDDGAEQVADLLGDAAASPCGIAGAPCP